MLPSAGGAKPVRQQKNPIIFSRGNMPRDAGNLAGSGKLPCHLGPGRGNGKESVGAKVVCRAGVQREEANKPMLVQAAGVLVGLPADVTVHLRSWLSPPVLGKGLPVAGTA